MHAGFEFVQVGRAIIKDLDIVNKWQSGTAVTSGCDHCNRCIVEMDRGSVKCVSNTNGPLITSTRGVSLEFRA